MSKTIQTTDPRPYFVHDCESCTYLGQTVKRWPDKVTAYDLYFCTQGGISPTVIARYGDEGSEYTSGLGPWIKHPALIEAAGIARERGLIDRTATETGPMEADRTSIEPREFECLIRAAHHETVPHKLESAIHGFDQREGPAWSWFDIVRLGPYPQEHLDELVGRRVRITVLD